MVANFVRSRSRGAPAGPDPWGGESLEWTIPSPPPDYNFERFPVVASTTPAWDVAEGVAPEPLAEVGGEDLTRAEGGHHRTLVTSVLDATRVDVVTMPRPSALPAVLALSIFLLATSVLARSALFGFVAVAVFALTLLRWHREIGS
jgi:hypothetical protein